MAVTPASRPPGNVEGMDHDPSRRDWPDWLDLEVEREYWRTRFMDLPCAKAGDDIHRCWPLIELVYTLYVRYPRASLIEALTHYEAGSRGHPHGMDAQQLTELFARIWGRILKVARGRTLPAWAPGGQGSFSG